MKHLARLLSLLITTTLITINGFSQNDHLEPIKDFESYEGILKEYYDKVFPLLYKGFNEKPFARYTSMPSFSREYSFSVEQLSNKYYIKSNTLSKNYWYAKLKMCVRVKTKKREISKEFYDLIGELFKIVIEQKKNLKN